MYLKSFRDSFATLGEVSRLRIACCLLFWKDGLCVGELVDALAESQPNISRHLKVMKASGLVEERRDGRWIYYRWTPSQDEFHQDLQGCLETVCGSAEMELDLSRLKTRLKLRKGGRCVEMAKQTGIKNEIGTAK
jgi:ArsR family transcriptional regulator